MRIVYHIIAQVWAHHGPSKASANINEHVSVCLCVCLCVCACVCVCLSVCLFTGFVPVMIKVGGVLARQFGRLTGMTRQSLDVAFQWQIDRHAHAKSWHSTVKAC